VWAKEEELFKMEAINYTGKTLQMRTDHLPTIGEGDIPR
jgi:hypothetical protein